MPEGVGDISAVQNEFGFDSDPLHGDSYVYTFSGSKGAIQLAMLSWRGLGARTSVVNDGALWKLKVFIGLDQLNGGVEIPVDVWEFDTENGHEDFYASVKVWQAVANTYGSANMEYNLSAIRKEIEDAISAGTVLDTAVTGTNDIVVALYQERARGGESTEIKRPVIKRTRYISPAYASPTIVEPIPRVWTTAALIRDFAIPAVIQIKLPSTPAFLPNNTAWGWKQREDRSRYHSPISKFEETATWYFAAWSTLRYDIVT